LTVSKIEDIRKERAWELAVERAAGEYSLAITRAKNKMSVWNNK